MNCSMVCNTPLCLYEKRIAVAMPATIIHDISSRLSFANFNHEAFNSAKRNTTRCATFCVNATGGRHGGGRQQSDGKRLFQRASILCLPLHPTGPCLPSVVVFFFMYVLQHRVWNSSFSNMIFLVPCAFPPIHLLLFVRREAGVEGRCHLLPQSWACCLPNLSLSSSSCCFKRGGGSACLCRQEAATCLAGRRKILPHCPSATCLLALNTYLFPSLLLLPLHSLLLSSPSRASFWHYTLHASHGSSGLGKQALEEGGRKRGRKTLHCMKEEREGRVWRTPGMALASARLFRPVPCLQTTYLYRETACCALSGLPLGMTQANGIMRKNASTACSRRVHLLDMNRDGSV